MIKAISRPIIEVDDLNEQKALIILSQLVKLLPAWRAGTDLRTTLEAQKLDSTRLQKRSDELRSEISDLDEQSKTLLKRKDFRLSLIKNIVAALLVTPIFIYILKIPVLTLVFIIPIIFFRKKLNKERAKLLDLKIKSEKAFAAVTDNASIVQTRIKEIQRELSERPLTFPSVAIADVGFPISSKMILGNSCILDASETFSHTALSTVDLKAVGAGLEPIAEAISRISSIPILLAPNSQDNDDEPIQKLYGEEDDFQRLVRDFTKVLGQVEDVKLSLPLIQKDSSIVRAIEEQRTYEFPAGNNLIIIEGAAFNQKAILEFVGQVNQLAATGQRTLASLNRTYEALYSTGQLYAQARSGSINHLHKELLDVLDRASWCSKRFYCPRSIQSPQYFYDTLGINIENAHHVPLGELIAQMSRDDIIAKRLAGKPDLIEQMRIASISVAEFRPAEAASEQMPAYEQEPRPSHIEDQYAEAIKQFRIALSCALFGSAQPQLVFSKESRLYYDPETEEWISDLIPHTYTTGQVQRYGQVLKVQSDLLFPMWEHLWTEKADFRKSELFRTNESLIRMSEKEAEKLIEIGNQFRADMRTVRENIYLLEPELVSKISDLKEFQIGMGALGLLSERQKQLLSNKKLGQLELPTQSLVADADTHETWLGYEPKNQALRRGTASDPICESSSPSILLSYNGVRSVRLLNN